MFSDTYAVRRNIKGESSCSGSSDTLGANYWETRSEKESILYEFLSSTKVWTLLWGSVRGSQEIGELVFFSETIKDMSINFTYY